MIVRDAEPEEAVWVQDRYDAVGFLPSDLSADIVLVAEIDGERAGLGRLVPLSAGAFELGGMLVFEPYRGRGVAKAIVAELLRRAGGGPVFCVPFANLAELYRGAGFVVVDGRPEDLPQRLIEKLAWCAANRSEPVLLMQLQR